MKRRSALKAIALLATLSNGTIAATQTRNIKRQFLHESSDIVIDQSGNLGNEDFSIASITCSNPGRLLQDILKLRQRTKYRITCTHTSRNKWKRNFSIGLIDLLLSRQDTRINIIIVSQKSNHNNGDATEKFNQHVDLVSRLVDNSTDKEIPLRRIVMQTHYRPGRQAAFEKALYQRTATISSIAHAKESESELLQLIDLIVGGIRAALSVDYTSITNKTKLEIIKYIQKRLESNNSGDTTPVHNLSVTRI